MSPIQQMLLGVGAVAEKTYVDDVFSTFLYRGTGNQMVINNGIKLGNAGVGSVIQSANSGANALVVSDSDDFQFYNGDFTFECFAKINDQGDDPDYIYIQRQNGPDPYVELRLDNSSGNNATVVFIVGGISGDSNKELEGTATNILDNNWHHIAATRSGNTWRLFADGTQIDTLTSSNTSIGNSPADPKIFGGGGSSETFRGALSSFRIVKGTALYTSNFTPPTTELTAITNTVLLLGVGSTPAVDASGQNHSISTTGTISSFTAGGPFTSSDAGLGGLVWTKNRETSYSHFLFDTERGTTKNISTNSASSEGTETAGVNAFNANGFSVGTNGTNDGAFNHTSYDYSSWTFRKAPGFFDIVTWTGDNDTNRAISHSLGSTPGMIIVKNTSNSFDWSVWHTSLWDTTNYYSLKLNSSAAKNGWNAFWSVSAPTSSNFYVRSNGANVSGQTYVAYVFAHDDQSFGEAKNASVIKCGSYVGNGSSTGPEINLGWEPQWILLKNTASEENWFLWDSMRGIVTSGTDSQLHPNTTGSENSSHNRIDLTSTGFKVVSNDGSLNESGATIIYTCLRRSDGYVGKPIEDATKCFAMDTGSGSSTIPNFDSGFPVDFTFMKKPASSSNWFTYARLTQKFELVLNSTAAQGGASDYTFDSNVGWGKGGDSSDWQSFMFKRHAGFDVVTYAGRQGGATVMNLNHNLGVIPEMIIIKKRNNNGMWAVYHKGVNGGTNPEQYMMQIDANAQEDQSTFMNDTAPTATVFTVGSMSAVNDSGDNYIAFLFSSIEGISKVGSYTGNGSATERTITLGFQPRFLIVKRADGSNDWIVFDTTRTWGSGNDYHLSLNTNAAQVESQDIGAPTSTGFTLNTALANYNANNSTYIYYAHA